jgi:hypothetical protein
MDWGGFAGAALFVLAPASPQRLHVVANEVSIIPLSASSTLGGASSVSTIDTYSLKSELRSIGAVVHRDQHIGNARMAHSRKIKLGFILPGVGRTWTDWRHPDRDVGGSTSLAAYADQARLAEQGKFDFLFVAHSLSITEKSSPH